MLEELENSSDADVRRVLTKLLSAYCTPAFGSLSKREIDLLVFSALRELKIFGSQDSLFTLMQKLRVSRPKARTMLYDLDVRSGDNTPEALDEQLRQILPQISPVQDGKYFVIQIESPLLLAHFKERANKLGFVTDASFEPSLVRLSDNALAGVAAELLPKDRREAIRNALVKAGAEDKSLPGILKTVLKSAVGKLAGEAAGEVAKGLADKMGDVLTPLFNFGADQVGEALKGFVEPRKDRPLAGGQLAT